MTGEKVKAGNSKLLAAASQVSVMKLTLIIFIVLLVCGCHQTATKSQDSTGSITKAKDSGLKNEGNKVYLEEDAGEKLRDTNYRHLNQLLRDVLNIAMLYKTDSAFNGLIDTAACHFKDMHASYEFGNIFSNERKHLLVKRFVDEYDDGETCLFSDIYILKGNRFIKLIADTAENGYCEDRLIDINLDGYKDFMISQYSHAGCCQRNDEVAYLYNHKNGRFVKAAFFNPEFDHKLQLI